MKKIAFGCDHVGFILKHEIVAHLVERGVEVIIAGAGGAAQLSRQHNDTNVLAFGSRVVGLELAKMIVDAWLGAQYEGGRHQQRVEAITAIEQRRN